MNAARELRFMEYETTSANRSGVAPPSDPVDSGSQQSQTTAYNTTMTETVVGYYDYDNGTLALLMSNVTHLNSSYGILQNGTNQSESEDDSGLYLGFTHLMVTSIILGLMILATIIGNVFVVAAIILERNLQSVANYLVMSLAVADLMVATLVMPISAVGEVTTSWFLGAEVCDMWISFDVLCCTASILHLVAIAIDRYWAVTQVDYIRQRTAKRIIIMIILVWTISISISIPPLFGWKDNNTNAYISGECIISQDWGYTVFSTGGAFYLPLFFMLIIYWKIFRAARSRIRKKKFMGNRSPAPTRTTTVTVNHSTPLTDGNNITQTQVSSSNSDSPDQPSNGSTMPHLNDANRNTKIVPDPPSNINYADDESVVDLEDSIHDNNHVVHSNSFDQVSYNAKSNSLSVPGFAGIRRGLRGLSSEEKKLKKEPKPPKTKTEKTRDRNREKIEHKRERKAARTLAIITGAFIFCWVPFFIIALVRPFYDERDKNRFFPRWLMSLTLWLGYFNSLLNPIIYTIFNPDFRNAFRKILFGKYRTRGGRRR